MRRNKLSQETKDFLINGGGDNPREVYLAAEDFARCGYSQEHAEDLLIEAMDMNTLLEPEDVLDAIEAAYENLDPITDLDDEEETH